MSLSIPVRDPKTKVWGGGGSFERVVRQEKGLCLSFVYGFVFLCVRIFAIQHVTRLLFTSSFSSV